MHRIDPGMFLFSQWAAYITEAISRYGKETEVTFQSHNWPHWSNDVVNEYHVNTATALEFASKSRFLLGNFKIEYEDLRMSHFNV